MKIRESKEMAVLDVAFAVSEFDYRPHTPLDINLHYGMFVIHSENKNSVLTIDHSFLKKLPCDPQDSDSLIQFLSADNSWCENLIFSQELECVAA